VKTRWKTPTLRSSTPPKAVNVAQSGGRRLNSPQPVGASDAAEPDRSGRPKDPYAREIEGFPIKQPPLVAQQITSSEDDHVLFVGVFRPYFCVKTPSERAQAGRAVYRPIARRLGRAGVHDFELVVTPVAKRAPERRDALAVGAAGSVELTRAGRRC